MLPTVPMSSPIPDIRRPSMPLLGHTIVSGSPQAATIKLYRSGKQLRVQAITLILNIPVQCWLSPGRLITSGSHREVSTKQCKCGKHRKENVMHDTTKYYMYISDAKLSMFYNQIPKGPLKSIAAELNINLSIFGSG